MANYGSTLSINSLPISAAATSSRRLRGSAALIGVFVVLCCLSYASLQSHLPAQVIALAAQQQLTPVAPLKISFDAKIGGADPRTHLNTFALSNVQLSGDPKWKDFANRATPFQARPFNNRGGFVEDKFPDKERRWLNHVLTHMSTKGGHVKPEFRAAIAGAFKAGRDSGVENDPLAQAEAALQTIGAGDLPYEKGAYDYRGRAKSTEHASTH